MKSTLYKLPEYYLILIIFLAAYSPPFSFNPTLIPVILILLIQIILKNRILGIALGLIFFLINIYFLGALISEFREFPEFTSESAELISVGLLIFILNLLMSSLMINKYYRPAGRLRIQAN